MVESVINTPWNTEMDPGEFEEYYDRKQENLERKCGREGCDETVMFPSRHCSVECRGIALREAVRRVEESM